MEALLYAADGFWREIGDQRVHSNYPLMSGGPIPIVVIVSAYLYFVRVLGPRFMKQRQPYDLKWTIRLYNVMMSLINLYAFYRVAVLTKFGLNYFGCKKVGTSREDNELVNLAFLYFATKLVELLDTVFFVLRKKYNQASNLHVFHHGFIAVCVWIYFKIAPGGSSVLFPFLNIGVHTIMYAYYFLATFKSMQPFLWWKRHLTEAQIVQFVLSMVHFSFQGLSSCQYPPALAIIGFTFNFVFFVLFCDFYYHAYLAKRKAPAPAALTTTTTTTTTTKHQPASLAAAASEASGNGGGGGQSPLPLPSLLVCWNASCSALNNDNNDQNHNHKRIFNANVNKMYPLLQQQHRQQQQQQQQQ